VKQAVPDPTGRETVRPEIVIFDFDGTIADTMTFLTGLAASALTQNYGMPPEQARRAYIQTSGLPFVKQIELVFPGDPRNPATVMEFEDRKKKDFMKHQLFPDAIGTVVEIRRCGMKVCVSSSNSEKLVTQLLESKNLEVDAVMGYHPGFEKGSDHFAFVIQRFNSSPGKLVFIGDSVKDGLAAQEAGVTFIAKTGLIGAEEFHESLPGIQIVDSLEEVLGCVGIDKAQDSSKAGESLKLL
jgi:phosphoglycolate phosphatase-like HAD superfamily hydrolase